METLIKKLVNFKSGEGRALFWSFAYFFLLISTYYMLLPIRDAAGIRGGAQDLPWLFLGTFVVSLLTAPLQATIAAKLPRQRFVPVAYLFLVANMLVFWALLRSGVATEVVYKAFFIWITVFSVFTVSIFWTFMSDLYATEQGKRLLKATIGAGGALLKLRSRLGDIQVSSDSEVEVSEPDLPDAPEIDTRFRMPIGADPLPATPRAPEMPAAPKAPKAPKAPRTPSGDEAPQAPPAPPAPAVKPSPEGR